MKRRKNKVKLWKLSSMEFEPWEGSEHSMGKVEPTYEEVKAKINGRLEPHFDHSGFGISSLNWRFA